MSYRQRHQPNTDQEDVEQTKVYITITDNILTAKIMDKYSNRVLKLQILNDTRIFYYKSQKLQHKLCQKRISHPQEPQNPDQPEQPQGHVQK